MGLNAQTAVPTFTASQVLTAAQQNQINTGIPVFATTTTRDAAFGGSNKTLAQGQYCYIEASSQLQVYTGSAWQSVGTGLTYITQATPTAVASVSINNCFTSTFANYLLLIDMTAAVGDGVITARLRSGGTDSNTNYVGQRLIGQATTVAATANPSGTDDAYFSTIQATTASSYALSSNIYSPALARGTVFNTFAGSNDGAGSVIQFVWNNHTTASAYDGITVFTSGTSFTGTIRVYGYQNS